MQTRLFEVQKPVEAIDPDYFARESTARELAARRRVRQMMFAQGWKLVYPKEV